MCLGKSFESLMKVEQVDLGGAAHGAGERQRDAFGAAAPFSGNAIARVVDEDPPHYHSGDPHELRAVRPVDPALIDQAHEGFMDERGRLQGVIGALAAQVARGKPPKLVVHDGHHRVGGRRRISGYGLRLVSPIAHVVGRCVKNVITPVNVDSLLGLDLEATCEGQVLCGKEGVWLSSCSE